MKCRLRCGRFRWDWTKIRKLCKCATSRCKNTKQHYSVQWIRKEFSSTSSCTIILQIQYIRLGPFSSSTSDLCLSTIMISWPIYSPRYTLLIICTSWWLAFPKLYCKKRNFSRKQNKQMYTDWKLLIFHGEQNTSLMRTTNCWEEAVELEPWSEGERARACNRELCGLAFSQSPL